VFHLSGEAGVGDEESVEAGWFDTQELPPDLTSDQLRRIACGVLTTGACVFDR